MSNEVFANGNEIACKSGNGKVIAAFPDVCLSPPSPPAGPLPVPYPNSSFSKDTKEGSRSVKISGEEVMLKDKSYYKTSPLGDEAATRSFGGSVVTHTITGKTYFVAWSMDVKFENENVDRHIDFTSSNHNSTPGSPPPVTPNAEKPASAGPSPTSAICECCKGPAHSERQKNGNSMTSDAFYAPSYPPPAPRPNRAEQKAIDAMKDIRAKAKADGCGYIFHDNDSDPCAKHYTVTKDEKDGIDGEYNAMMSPLTREQNPDWFIGKYGEALGKEIIARGKQMENALKSGTSSIAHKTPRAAGGCPIGDGNLKPVEPKCKGYEDAAGQNQGQIAAYHRRVSVP